MEGSIEIEVLAILQLLKSKVHMKEKKKIMSLSLNKKHFGIP